MLSAAFLPFPLDGSATLHRVFTVPWLGRDVIITPTSRVGGRVRVLGSGVFDFSLHDRKLRIVPDRTLRRGADFSPADTDALGKTRQILKCGRDHVPYEPPQDDKQNSGAGIPDVLAADSAYPLGTVSLAYLWGDTETGECREVMVTLHSGQTLLALRWKGLFDDLPSIFLPTGEMLYDGQRNETDLSLLADLLLRDHPRLNPRMHDKQTDTWLPNDQLLELTCLLSRAIRGRTHVYDRSALYALKDRLTRQLVERRVLKPTMVLSAHWHLGEQVLQTSSSLARDMQYSVLKAWRNGADHPWGHKALPSFTAIKKFIEDLVMDAVWGNTPFDLQALEARGISLWWLTPEDQQTPAEKATAKRNLHPQARWLVGFGTDEDPELLHMPYLLAKSFVDDLPEPSAEREINYTRSCSKSECRSWPLERILFQLGEAHGAYLQRSASTPDLPSPESQAIRNILKLELMYGPPPRKLASGTD